MPVGSAQHGDYMIILFIFGLIIFICLFSPFVRTLIFNPFKTIFYSLYDSFNYFKQHRYDSMECGKLICYTALFGGGKTLSCVHYVNSLYHRYNGKRVFDVNRQKWVTQKIHIISNVDLTIPFERFYSLSQIVRVAEQFKLQDEIDNTLTCTIVLGDEFSVQMNSRSFKTNIDPLFLNTLLTCRHHHILFIYNAQRFNHVDALLRQVTSYVVECRKVWRVILQSTFDAYVLENCSDPTIIKPLATHGWFVRNKDFALYDTLACVGNLKKSVDENDMLSEIEIINAQAASPKDIGKYKNMRKVFKKNK